MNPSLRRSNGGASAVEPNAEGVNFSSHANVKSHSGGPRHGGHGGGGGGGGNSRGYKICHGGHGGGMASSVTANVPPTQQQQQQPQQQQSKMASSHPQCLSHVSMMEMNEDEGAPTVVTVTDNDNSTHITGRVNNIMHAVANVHDGQNALCENEDSSHAASIIPVKSSPDADPQRGDGRRRRRQWWWWRQQQRRRRKRSQSRMDQNMLVTKCDGGNQGRFYSGPYRSTLHLNPHVRCVESNGFSYNRTFKELLLAQGTEPPEADTPCLGPTAAPLCIPQLPELNLATDLENEEEFELKADCGKEGSTTSSPTITFTLDGVATPKTFAAIKLQGRDVGTISLPASCLLGGDPDGPRIRSSLRRPPPAIRIKELPHQIILRSYMNGCFLFYQTEETKQEFLGLCREVLAQARPIFESEPLFPRLVAPTFVFGDIHGNFEDLAFFLRNVLVFSDLQLTPANILCLGDYVDRGPYSLECLILLLSLKISHPSKVVMLRGNHEDRVVCGDLLTYGSASFLAQCEALYGVDEGRKLFKELTALFRHFPLAAELVIPAVANNSGNNINTTSSGNNNHHNHNYNNNNNNNTNSPGDLAAASVSRLLTSQGRRRTTHEERVLCTHGGIPRFFSPPKEDDSLAFLRREDFPRMLTLFPNNPFVRDDPEAQMELLGAVGQTGLSHASSTPAISEAMLRKAWFVAFDLMWSDPTIHDPSDDDNESSTSPLSGNGHAFINEWGFGVNKRGSNVLTFSAKALETFLQAHQYSMLFRAHQEKTHGLRLSKSTKVLTIFSSSNYLGHGNGAGCVLVTADGEIQLVEKLSE
ncbi:serine/threonine protein phosphatase-like protein, putative [Trypanosoma cruzi marinkellei]|uniref:Serine/threonine-protein phosphatase n=1 Tax=Trypanosoma cruzi marinkellei TaxID=85056 RepID=K2NLJ6_TRYCR|nr:serine/threonine protein phosphatase-like protein, putative [Trypanosoma cruzi marinkellei]